MFVLQLDAKSRPTFKEIVQQLEEALKFPLVSSNISRLQRYPVCTTRSNPCSTAMVEARSEEFLLQGNGPEENNRKTCNTKSITNPLTKNQLQKLFLVVQSFCTIYH